MNFDIKEAVEILERTPSPWSTCYPVYRMDGLGAMKGRHLECHGGDRAPYRSRADQLDTAAGVLLQEGEGKPFPPFDRYAHLNEAAEQSIDQKLQAFKAIRAQNLAKLKVLMDSAPDFERTGLHPAFGVVKLRELLSTWVVHDLTHTSQIVRVLAERYRHDVGPWIEYLGILKRR